jgi:two-component system, sensor histidine kinase and response regulator
MHKPHILIVDDVARNIQVVANILKHEQCLISFAQSGEKALELIGKEVPDLVLLDVMMPNLDGYEVCEHIKKHEATKVIPIIFLTAKNDIESITKAFQSGGVDYITKPFNNEELRARVRTHLNLRAAFKQISEQKSELAELNAIKDKFFNIIAHDLRNPFNGLLVLTDILKEKITRMDKKEIRTMIDLLHNSSKDGYELLENLLEWSRSQRNVLEFNPSEIRLHQMVRGNIHLLTPLAVSKKIRLSANISEDIMLNADRHMLDTVLRNLITNAIKFTPEEGNVKISAKVEKESVVVTIKDSGIGISAGDLEKLFKTELKFSTQGTAKERGTGLGLVLCKEFIDKHSGRIWAESEVGRGSSFKFSLPSQKE